MTRTVQIPCKRRVAGTYECAGWTIQRQDDTCGPQGISYRWLRESPNHGESWHETKREAIEAARQQPVQ